MDNKKIKQYTVVFAAILAVVFVYKMSHVNSEVPLGAKPRSKRSKEDVLIEEEKVIIRAFEEQEEKFEQEQELVRKEADDEIKHQSRKNDIENDATIESIKDGIRKRKNNLDITQNKIDNDLQKANKEVEKVQKLEELKKARKARKISSLKEVNDVKAKLEIEWAFWLKTKRTDQTIKFQKDMKKVHDNFTRDLKKALDSGKTSSFLNFGSLVNDTVKSVSKRINPGDISSKAASVQAAKERKESKKNVQEEKDAREKASRVGREKAIRVRDDGLAELKRKNRDIMLSFETSKDTALQKRFDTQDDALEKRKIEIDNEYKKGVELLD